MDGVGGAHYLTYWNVSLDAEVEVEVTRVNEVAAHADAALTAYRETDFGYSPGLTVMRGVRIPEDSLGVCVSSDGWAIIHTNDEYFQTVTHSDRELDGMCQRVWFGDILEVPSICFIDRESAVAVIDAWMSRGELLEAAGFSDDLFTC